MIYHQDHPTFKAHVAKLVKMTIEYRGLTPYYFRTEEFSNQDDVLSSEWVTCGHCSKRISVKEECRWIDSGYVSFLDNVRYSKCCGSQIEDKLCAMVCVCCQRPAAYITPHSNPTGFEFKAGRPYHIDSCSECCGKEGLESIIIEQVVHNNLNKSKKLDHRIVK